MSDREKMTRAFDELTTDCLELGAMIRDAEADEVGRLVERFTRKNAYRIALGRELGLLPGE